ncbi:SRPBCC family protein [Xanthomonas sp. WHRI 1810A]|uniref:SRPBCC family protein n=1 Tax=Xanthomonas sp. WHRI 1810A TaxID=3161565 RepID=UPI0032E8F8CF
MATASATLNLPVSADTVWQLVGGFLSLPDWLPFIASSEPAEGGRVRKLTTEDGASITERLESFDNQARTYSYSITEGPFPISEYLATLQVTAVGDNQTQVTWSGRFTPNGVSDAEVTALFQGIYDGGLEALKANF